MHHNEPNYRLVDMGWNDWRFQESKLMQFVTERFDQIHESVFEKSYPSRLKRLLKEHPGHIDAIHHYGLVQTQKGNALEALAFRIQQ